MEWVTEPPDVPCLNFPFAVKFLFLPLRFKAAAPFIGLMYSLCLRHCIIPVHVDRHAAFSTFAISKIPFVLLNAPALVAVIPS